MNFFQDRNDIYRPAVHRRTVVIDACVDGIDPRLVRGGFELFATASKAGGEERGEPAQVELAFSEASILLAREGDLRILAVTQPDPVAGLVFFDLGICLRKVAGAEPTRRRLRVLRAVAADPPFTGEDGDGAA